MTSDLLITPEFPLVVINPRFVEGRYDSGSIKRFYWMGEFCFKAGTFTRDTYVFDNHARKYEIINVRMIRRTYDFTGLFFKRSYIKVAFEYKLVAQLTFDEVRSEVLEHICRKRWYGQTGGTQETFRKITNACADMQALSDHVQFYGKWLR